MLKDLFFIGVAGFTLMIPILAGFIISIAIGATVTALMVNTLKKVKVAETDNKVGSSPNEEIDLMVRKLKLI